MDQVIRKISLAVSLGCGALVAMLGAFRGLNVGEVALVAAVAISALFILMTLLSGYFARVITRKLASHRAERAARHLIEP